MKNITNIVETKPEPKKDLKKKIVHVYRETFAQETNMNGFRFQFFKFSIGFQKLGIFLLILNT